MNSLDSNILVYAVSPAEGPREMLARELLHSATQAGWPVAAQVYGEFFSVMTRRQDMKRKAAHAAMQPCKPSAQ